ncbi:MAG: hypothetical protein EON93_04060 [Burkholderiales bacterium]|nr:MAG: hypothetical protein EON93_04060 [Burkholderiales bacterium]
MSFQQLNPTIPVTVIGKGDGYAFAVIDYGQEHNLIWVTAINETAEVWCAPNPMVRMKGNWTMGRERPSVPPPRSALTTGVKPFASERE